MFVFVIPRTPLKHRTPLRNDLWELSKQSLMAQTCPDWKAIIIGVPDESERSNPNFIIIEKDEYPKKEKIQFALDFLRDNESLKATHLIRFDDDDIFSTTILSRIAAGDRKFDCVYDRFHTYFDPVYMKVSCKKNNWIANTAIHAYEHAICICGPSQKPLLAQDHDEYWHVYYKDKNVYCPPVLHPVYYRILSPLSITGRAASAGNGIEWRKYLDYLKGYGPWISISSGHNFYNELKLISTKYFRDKPALSFFYWLFNRIKFLKNRF